MWLETIPALTRFLPTIYSDSPDTDPSRLIALEVIVILMIVVSRHAWGDGENWDGREDSWAM